MKMSVIKRGGAVLVSWAYDQSWWSSYSCAPLVYKLPTNIDITPIIIYTYTPLLIDNKNAMP